MTLIPSRSAQSDLGAFWCVWWDVGRTGLNKIGHGWNRFGPWLKTDQAPLPRELIRDPHKRQTPAGLAGVVKRISGGNALGLVQTQFKPFENHCKGVGPGGGRTERFKVTTGL
jgi:hypothetical protein